MTSDSPTANDPALHDLVANSMPFCAHLGVNTTSLVPSEVILTLDWKPEWCTIGGTIHGGVLMALADSAGAVCAFLNLPEGATATSTIESKTNFMRPVREGTVIATARPLHTGRTTIVIETELRHNDRLVAKTTQTQAVVHP
ncbi:MAG: PaaI family thioesterase [Acidimicrobiales bacterium]